MDNFFHHNGFGKHVKNVVFATFIKHNMLIKSSNLTNVYRPAFFADNILGNENIVEGEWLENQSNNTRYELQVPQPGHNASLPAKSIRETFKYC